MKRSTTIAILILILIVAGIVVYIQTGPYKISSNTSGTIVATSTPDRTPDEIFADVSSQLGFTRAQVGYFYIFGQDKVQYNANIGGSAVYFAYKENGTWHLSGRGSQEVPLCSTLVGVPVQYRQECYDPATDTNMYTDAQGQNANYPRAQGVKYIGQ